MSLLERVELASGSRSTPERPFENGDYARRLREALYEELPGCRIAELLDTNPERAAREVRGALEMILKTRDLGIPAALRAGVARGVLDMIVGLGPIQALIDDPSITEVMVNGPGSVFYERAGILHESGVCFADEAQIRLVIDKILGPVGRRVDEQSPMASARLKEGHRINVVLPPLALDGPYVTIRKFREQMFTLGEMCEIGTIDESVACFLSWAVTARKNIAVSGGTGSGKTTFLNSLSRQISPRERVITIEDAAELRFDWHPHVVRMESRPVNTEGGGEITIRDLVINALRMRPDRIVVGECRGAEALDMLQAMSTGHDGSLTTLHANSPADVVRRLVMMVRFGSDLPVDVIEGQVASALDLIVHLQRQADGSRKVIEIASFPPGCNDARPLPCALWDRKIHAYRWDVPCWVSDLIDAGIASREEVESWESSLLHLLSRPQHAA